VTHPQEDPGERLRTAPVDRFAGESRVVDLEAALTRLRAEEHEAKDGHRQITVFRRAPVAYVLFAFDEGGKMEQHAAHGLVAIQVLEGRMRVRADGGEHNLAAGHVLILNPGVLHDVLALEASAMLLTVHMEAGPK